MSNFDTHNFYQVNGWNQFVLGVLLLPAKFCWSLLVWTGIAKRRVEVRL